MPSASNTNKDVNRLTRDLAEAVTEGLNVKDQQKTQEAFNTFFTEHIKSVNYLRCLHYITINEIWYLCLRRIYETTDYLDTLSFLVELDVPAGGNKSYSIDLTESKVCCVCPKYMAAADLGEYVKLTNLINESPVDFKVEHYKDKYAARNRPMPTNIGESLRYGYDYVVFPKRKVKVTFSNTHSTDAAHAVFYADFMRMDIDIATKYMTHIYNDMVAQLLSIMFGVEFQEEKVFW